MDQHTPFDRHDGHLSRRQALRGLLAAGGAAMIAPTVLGGRAGAVARHIGAVDSTPGERLAEVLGLDPAAANGAGQSWRIGAIMPLTGNGAAYGTQSKQGIDLAIKHILEAGGPDIDVVYHDHRSGDVQAATTAMTELGTAGIPAVLSSYAHVYGSLLALTEQYKCFTLDGQAGTSVIAQGKPYFWGPIAVYPIDQCPLLAKYAAETQPDATTFGVVVHDYGEANNVSVRAAILDAWTEQGWEHNGLYETIANGTTDFSAVFTKIRENQPDVLYFAPGGQDLGFFLDQLQLADLDTVVLGATMNEDSVTASNGALDANGFVFGGEYFDAAAAVNPLARLFVEAFEAEYGVSPRAMSANMYETTLMTWAAYRRVLQAGGDVNDGTALDEAWAADPSHPSVYGGDADAAGLTVLSTETHTVSERTLGVFERKDGEITTLALAGLGGVDFRFV